MYKRHSSQISLFENPEMFGNLPLNPEDDWVRMAKMIPWAEFELRYEKHFKSRKGQPACFARMALASLIFKARHGFWQTPFSVPENTWPIAKPTASTSTVRSWANDMPTRQS